MILDEIAAKTKVRIEEEKKKMSLMEIRLRAEAMEERSGRGFYESLSELGVSYICEVKKASPSKGVIATDFPYMDIAKEYQSAGASAISVLTEPYYFQGSNQYVQEIATAVDTPCLRKDFTVDEYMLYEAKLLGASAVLLICAILDQKTLVRYLEIAHELGLDALVETHDEEEVKRALDSGARIIGVNNRNLQTFEVDIHNCMNLRHLVPKDKIFVAESGIHTDEDIKALTDCKVDAVLIGEALMRQADKKATLTRWKGL